MKAGGAMKPWPEPVEKKRAVLFEVNAFIARIMDKKKRDLFEKWMREVQPARDRRGGRRT